MKEVEDLVVRDDEQAVRLAVRGGELGDELRRGDADRAGDLLFGAHALADELGDLLRRAEAATRSGDVEEGLVDTERLDERSDVIEDAHDLTADRGVLAVARWDVDGVRGEFACAGDRHGRVDTEGTGLVGRR